MAEELKTENNKLVVNGNIIDKVINYINPEKGLARFKSRVQYAIAGGYIGGKKFRRAQSGWNPGGNDPDGDTLQDLPYLIDKSRDLIRNNPIATGINNTSVTKVVGTGLKFRSIIDREVLNLTEEEASKLESQIEKEFALWSETKDCSIDRKLDFIDMQELIFRSSNESGDVFSLLPRKAVKGTPYKTRIQIIEADRVSNPDHKSDTNLLSGGIETDENGAPTAYHITNYHPGSLHPPKNKKWDKVQAFGSGTGRRNVLHHFRTLRPGQKRGIPELAPVIESLKQISNYTEAELMAAVVSGMFTVFVTQEAGIGGLDTIQTDAKAPGSENDKDYKLTNAAMVTMAPGEKIDIANPGRPNSEFDPFIQAILRQVGAATGIPFELLIKHFTSSYSASRAALLEAWEFFKVRRKWLVRSFCQPSFEEFMTEAVELRRLNLPGFFDDPIIRKAYLGSKWVGPAPGQIDPLREANAVEKRLALGTSTGEDETDATSGGNYEKNQIQLAKEMRLRQKLGLEPISNSSSEVPEDMDDTDDKVDEIDKKEKGEK